MCHVGEVDVEREYAREGRGPQRLQQTQKAVPMRQLHPGARQRFEWSRRARGLLGGRELAHEPRGSRTGAHPHRAERLKEPPHLDRARFREEQQVVHGERVGQSHLFVPRCVGALEVAALDGARLLGPRLGRESALLVVQLPNVHIVPFAESGGVGQDEGVEGRPPGCRGGIRPQAVVLQHAGQGLEAPCRGRQSRSLGLARGPGSRDPNRAGDRHAEPQARRRLRRGEGPQPARVPLDRGQGVGLRGRRAEKTLRRVPGGARRPALPARDVGGSGQ
mmetsp:Transcript_22130/g.63398  ORF Transcript_22130/g.63398 Transcript_22130/m.63398 type:complete len:277 (-) Transcript_22130:121-951(-)